MQITLHTTRKNPQKKTKGKEVVGRKKLSLALLCLRFFKKRDRELLDGSCCPSSMYTKKCWLLVRKDVMAKSSIHAWLFFGLIHEKEKGSMSFPIFVGKYANASISLQ